ncbi:pilus assembly FimT family protein [Pseudoalteromonas aurantia]|uniref:pilus assembly FimT family protein n=1 Tax=Pseudoalteromonas aurantia TaxID=43654 RepID=UPI001787AE1D|nr:type II secretion system protein [Pseudoalteromonas aurantia]
MQKSLGYTLIEIMIVMTVVSLLIGFVGPFTIDAIERTERKSETLQFKSLLKKAGYDAYIRQIELIVTLTGSSITVASPNNETRLYQHTFEHLNFPAQSLYINSNGFISPDNVDLQSGEKQVKVELGEAVNGVHEVSNEEP